MKTLSSLVVAVLVAACTPSIDGAAKADLDRRLAAMQPAGRQVEAPAAPAPMPLEVGQWLVIKQVDAEGRPSLSTYKIVGAEGDAWWLEVDSETYFGRSGVRMLVALGDRQDPAAFELRRVFTRDNGGTVTEMPPPMLGMMRSTYQPILDSMVIRWDALPQEDAAVIAGAFAGCYRGVSSVAVAGRTIASDVWWHPAVPINGVVRAVGHDPATTTELVDFGTTGATSSF